MIFEPDLLVLGQAIAGDALDAFLVEQQHQRRKALLLVLLQPLDLAQQLFELLLRRAAVRALQRDALAHLAGKTGDADHEEFIEIGGRDRQEADALQQRMIGVQRFFENAPVELQPGKLAVDEAVRVATFRADHLDIGEFALHRLQFVHSPCSFRASAG